MGKESFLSKQDLKDGFHQICIKAEDIEQTPFKYNINILNTLFVSIGLYSSPSWIAFSRESI